MVGARSRPKGIFVRDGRPLQFYLDKRSINAQQHGQVLSRIKENGGVYDTDQTTADILLVADGQESAFVVARNSHPPQVTLDYDWTWKCETQSAFLGDADNWAGYRIEIKDDNSDMQVEVPSDQDTTHEGPDDIAQPLEPEHSGQTSATLSAFVSHHASDVPPPSTSTPRSLDEQTMPHLYNGLFQSLSNSSTPHQFPLGLHMFHAPSRPSQLTTPGSSTGPITLVPPTSNSTERILYPPRSSNYQSPNLDPTGPALYLPHTSSGNTPTLDSTIPIKHLPLPRLTSSPSQSTSKASNSIPSQPKRGSVASSSVLLAAHTPSSTSHPGAMRTAKAGDQVDAPSVGKAQTPAHLIFHGVDKYQRYRPMRLHVLACVPNRQEFISLITRHGATHTEDIGECDYALLSPVHWNDSFSYLGSRLLKTTWVLDCLQQGQLVDQPPYTFKGSANPDNLTQIKGKGREVTIPNKADTSGAQSPNVKSPVTKPRRGAAEVLKLFGPLPVPEPSRSSSRTCRFTAADQQYFISQAREVLRHQPECHMNDILKAMALAAKHHSASSWRTWYDSKKDALQAAIRGTDIDQHPSFRTETSTASDDSANKKPKFTSEDRALARLH